MARLLILGSLLLLCVTGSCAAGPAGQARTAPPGPRCRRRRRPPAPAAPRGLPAILGLAERGNTRDFRADAGAGAGFSVGYGAPPP